MSSTLSLHFYLEDVISEYEKLVSQSKDEDIRSKYTHYIEALKNLDKRIGSEWDFNSSGMIEEILTENYSQYDTEFICWNSEKSFIIPKDIITMVKGDLLCVMGTEEEFQKQLDENNYPVIQKAIDVDSISEIRTIK